jgi:hypothetical protein
MYHERHAAPLTDYVHEQVTALRGLMHRFSSQRLNPQLYLSLLDQMVLLPMLFTYHDDVAREHRRELINEHGIFGIIASALETELAAKSRGQIERNERSGIITEYAALGVFTYEQSANRTALPSLPVEDEWQGVDMQCYVDTGTETLIRGRQVKSDELTLDVHALQLQSLIGGRALGNLSGSPYWTTNYPNQTTQAIVDIAAGRATNTQESTLKRIGHDLVAAVIADQPFLVLAQAPTARLA